MSSVALSGGAAGLSRVGPVPDLRALGKDATIYVYEATDHAFFNDDRPDVYDAAASSTAWERTLELLRAGLA